MKTTSLENFQFDKFKSCHILESFIDSSGRSQASIAKEIGLTYDTLRNCLRGGVQQISIERVFKICVATAHSMEEYLRHMLEDEPIDFADRIIQCSKNCGEMVCTTNQPGKSAEKLVPDVVPDTVIPPSRNEIASGASIERAIERVSSQYSSHISLLKESRDLMKTQYESEIAMLNTRYERSIEHLKDEIKDANDELQSAAKDYDELQNKFDSLHKRHNRFRTILLTENVAFLSVLLYDITHGNIGWIEYSGHLLQFLFPSLK